MLLSVAGSFVDKDLCRISEENGTTSLHNKILPKTRMLCNCLFKISIYLVQGLPQHWN